MLLERQRFDEDKLIIQSSTDQYCFCAHAHNLFRAICEKIRKEPIRRVTEEQAFYF